MLDHSHCEPLKLAVLKQIEYVLSNLGCSLNMQLVDVLKKILKLYPHHAPQTQSNYQGFFCKSKVCESHLVELKEVKISTYHKSSKHLYN